MPIQNPRTASPIIYKGFSTIGTELKRNWSLYNVDLVKRDLRNHFATFVGSRVMRPDWGCKIWDYLFDPLDDNTTAAVINAAMEVINAEPRVKLINMNVLNYDYGIRIEIILEYIFLGVVDTMLVDFDRATVATWGGGM